MDDAAPRFLPLAASQRGIRLRCLRGHAPAGPDAALLALCRGIEVGRRPLPVPLAAGAEIELPIARIPRIELPAELRFGGLFTVKGRIGRTRVTIIVDTGAERTLGNDALLSALELQAKAEDPSYHARVLGATSHAQQGAVIPAPAIRIGEVSITSTQVAFGDFAVFGLWGLDQRPALLLGMDVIGAADGLMIDYRREEMLLLPSGASALASGLRRHGSRIR